MLTRDISFKNFGHKKKEVVRRILEKFFYRGSLSVLLGREVAGGVRDYFGDSEAAEPWRRVGMES